MNARAQRQLAAATAMLLLAAILTLRHWRGAHAAPQAYFYDLSKGALFEADSNLIPPIRGIDNAEEDGVKAVVVASNPNDRKTRRIAYLERYAPELKRDLEDARTRHSSPLIDRASAQALRSVKRPGDKEWSSLISEEGQRIVNEWATPGPDGLSPVVCLP